MRSIVGTGNAAGGQSALSETNSFPMGSSAKPVTTVFLVGARLCTPLASFREVRAYRALREVRTLGIAKVKHGRVGLGMLRKCNGLINGEEIEI